MEVEMRRVNIEEYVESRPRQHQQPTAGPSELAYANRVRRIEMNHELDPDFVNRRISVSRESARRQLIFTDERHEDQFVFVPAAPQVNQPAQPARRRRVVEKAKNIESIPMPTGTLQVYFHTSNSSESPEHVVIENCASNFYLDMIDIDPRLYPNEEVGVVCHRNGLLFWYKVIGAEKKFVRVNINGLALPGSLSKTSFEYPLLTPGLLGDIETDPDGLKDNRCITRNQQRFTDLCYRTTGKKCRSLVSICKDSDECACYSRYTKDGSRCRDIDECGGNHTCDTETETCMNAKGSYWCKPKRTAAVSSQNTCNSQNELDLGVAGNVYCVPKAVVTPPEISCTIEPGLIAKVLFPVGTWPASKVLAGKTVSISMKSFRLTNGDEQEFWTETSSNLLCKNYPYTMMGPKLLRPIDPYSVTDSIDLPVDMMLDVTDRKNRNVGLSDVSVECYANAILAWGMHHVLFRELEISFAELVPEWTHASVKKSVPRTTVIGTIRSDGGDRETEVCGRTGAENDTLSVGCKCRSGYVTAENDTCVDATLCTSGLRVLGNRCVDVDECAEGTATCKNGCRNVYGGYECNREVSVSREDCPFGTRFDNDTSTCEDIDECAEGTATCKNGCRNVYGGYECNREVSVSREDCPFGTSFDNDTSTCEDIDECALNTDTCDPLSTDCTNTEGGFECVCKDPSLSLMPSLTSCEKSKYEFRLLDFDKMRCCKHGSGDSAFLVRGRLGGLHSRYSEITPVACIEVTDVDYTRIPWTYAKPYVVSGMGENEVETLLNLVDFVRETKREERTLVELVYKDGCRQTFALGNGNDRTEPPLPPPKYYISYTPVTYTYFDPKNRSFDKCRRKVGDIEVDPDGLYDDYCITTNEQRFTDLCYRNTGEECQSSVSICRSFASPLKLSNKCVCYTGYVTDGGCIDINECAGYNICNPRTETCMNVKGSYWCKPKTTAVSSDNTCNSSNELDLGVDGNIYCVPKVVITPPEIYCTIEPGLTAKILFPVGASPVSDVLAGKTVSISMKSFRLTNGGGEESLTDTSFDLVCKNHPYTIMGPKLLRPIDSYSVTDSIDLPIDMRLDITDRKNRNVGFSDVSVECYTNAILVWGMNNVSFHDLEISFVELVPGMEKTSMKYFRIENDRNRKLDTRKCKKVGSTDDCYWYDSFRRCDRETKVCGRTGAENDTLSVGCKCRSGYALAEDDTCVDTTLCIPGLRVLGNQCVDIDECAEGTATCKTGCRNVYGGYECVSREDCPFGTRFDNDTLTCEDIDECALNTDTCDPLSTDCRNIEGGFECVCKDPSLSLMPSLTSCRKSKYEFRLLDFNKMRCCKHGSGGSAFLVRGRLGGLHSRYSEITPVACIEVTDVDFTRIPWTYTKPYVVSGMGENEVETLLNLVDFVRETKREERTLVELVYKDGCRQTFALGNGNNRTEPPPLSPPKYYISYTPVTYTYFDPKNRSFDKCRRKVGNNVDWLSQNLWTRRTTSVTRTDCVRNNTGNRVVGPA
ncbi:hypothetical protein KUTeg_010551, partial [Tegillarca granosa]